MKGTDWWSLYTELLILVYILQSKALSPQAVCFPYSYQEKTRRQTTKAITLQLVSPVLVLSLLLNVTKFIAITPLGPELQLIPEYLKFLLFFQAVHPLTTTGLAPLVLLTTLNYKVLILIL